MYGPLFFHMYVRIYVCMYICMYILLASVQSMVVKAVMEHFKFKISLSWTVTGIENPASPEG